MGRAFTLKGDGIARALNTEVLILSNGKGLKVKALWDTGATSSCISQEVVQKLGLIATGRIDMYTPSGKSEGNTYLVNIGLPNNVIVKNVMVADSEIGAQGIGMLIGMNIITSGDFAISNKDNKTVFTFRMPSEKVTDYVLEAKISDKIGPKHGKKKK